MRPTSPTWAARTDRFGCRPCLWGSGPPSESQVPAPEPGSIAGVSTPLSKQTSTSLDGQTHPILRSWSSRSFGDRHGWMGWTVALADMTSYDRAAWEDLARWRQARLSGSQRHLVPEAIRRRAARAGKSAQSRLNDLPGADQFVETVRKSLDGLLELVSRAAEASLRRSSVVKAYSKLGHTVSSLDNIRKLELQDVDRAKPRLGLQYTAASTAEGAAAGFAVSGGEIIASAVSAPGENVP